MPLSDNILKMVELLLIHKSDSIKLLLKKMKVKKNMNTSSKVHLAKYLKECGNYTKSQVQDLIKQKRVLVNHHYYPLSYIVKESDIIRVDGMVLSKVPYVYYLYHKPVGIVCTNNLNIKIIL